MIEEQLWREWGRLTRFYESTRIALSREKSAWNALDLQSAADARIQVAEGASTYQVRVTQHREALSDAGLFGALVIIHSYALAEYAAASLLKDDAVIRCGIENWGTLLLARADTDWRDVKDGKAGLVEVATIRNHLAHGDRVLDQGSLNRLKAANAQGNWSLGAEIRVDDEMVDTHRARLKSLLRCAEIRPKEKR